MIDKRLYERALEPFKNSGTKMEDFRLSDEARELLGVKPPSWSNVQLENHDLVTKSIQNYIDDLYLRKRMEQLEPEIRKALEDSGYTPEELAESCERVRKYWRLIDIQQAASAVKEER